MQSIQLILILINFACKVKLLNEVHNFKLVLCFLPPTQFCFLKPLALFAVQSVAEKVENRIQAS